MTPYSSDPEARDALQAKLRTTAAVILAAGHGTRMKTTLPKVLQPLAGLPLLRHVLNTVEALGAGCRLVVCSPALQDRLPAGQVITVVQDPPRGTGDAIRLALAAVPAQYDRVLILCADTPLLEVQTLLPLFAHDNAVMTMHLRRDQLSLPYGRVIGNPVSRIVEYRDANAQERAVPAVNSGVMLLERRLLETFLPKLQADNAAGEYYLTDVIGMAAAAGCRIAAVEGDAKVLQGINTLAELAEAEQTMQNRLRRRHMLAGVRITDPGSVYFCHDTQIAADCVLEHNISFGPGVALGARTRVLPFCRLEGVVTGEDVTVGPFAHLRPGTQLHDNSAVGNFVEIKNTVMASGAKAKHLSYLGDADIGSKCNIGAGTITCNYDGINKHKTVIGDGAFIGANSTLVAPVTVGERGTVAAGSVITEPVSEGALAFGRARQCERPGGAKKADGGKANPES